MTTFDELFAEHNLTPNERKALVMHLATLRAQKTVEALQDCPLASAPSTPPHAVVGAVPLIWHLDADAAETLKQTIGDDDTVSEITLSVCDGHEGHGLYVWLTEYPEEGSLLLRGIAPKAAQPQEKREPWLCLLCKRDSPGPHGLLDDGKTPCPEGKAKP